MKEQIEQIKKSALEEIQKSENSKILNEVKVKYLGKKGELTQVLRGMKELAQEERPIIGSIENEARNEREKEKKEEEEKLKEKKDKKQTPELTLIQNEHQKLIINAINALKPKFKEVVMLYEIEQLSYEQIARKIKTPIGTVKSRLYNAKKELAQSLKDLI